MFDAPAALETTALEAVKGSTPPLENLQDEKLREAAKEFEVVFVTEMLKAAKIGEAKGPFTGGYGEEAFRSFLVKEYAVAITEQQSLGIADKLYQSLKEKVASNG